MRSIRLTLLAAAAMGAVSIGGASTMPFNSGLAAPGASLVQDVRLVCDRFGQCYETRRSNRSRSYYAPREYNRPAYYGGYHGGPRVGVGIGPGGIGVGIGGR